MVAENVIREIVSKMCRLHGRHPTVEINKEGQINISACCDEFREQMLIIENYMNSVISMLRKTK
jgi:hypothetical protein